MMFNSQPNFPRLNRALRTDFRPVATLTAMGAAYAAVRQIMQTPRKAFRAASDPNEMIASRTCTTILSIIALKGTLSLGWTWRHQREPGMAPSRAKAQVQREADVVQVTPQSRPRTMRGMSSAMPPFGPTADLIISGTGWAISASVARSGRTKVSGMRNARPRKMLAATVITMALGIWMAGWRTSSHMQMTMPVVDVQ